MSTEERPEVPEPYPTSEIGIEIGMLVSAMVFAPDDISIGGVDLVLMVSKDIDDLELVGPSCIAHDVSIAEVVDIARDDDKLTLYAIRVLSCTANYEAEEIIGNTYLVHFDDLSPMDSEKAFNYLLEQIDILHASSLTGNEAIQAIRRLYQEMKGFLLDDD